MPFELSHRESAKLALRNKREGAQVPTSLDLPEAPNVNALAFALRYLPGGKKRFLEFVKLAVLNGDPAAKVWWAAYADLTTHQRLRVSFDDICEAVDVKPSMLMAAIVGHGMEAAADVGTLIAAAFHPQVVQAAGESALRIDGEHAEIALEDRKNLLMARGFLPVPKGTAVHVHASANAQAAAASSSEPSVPKFAQDMEALSDPDDHLITDGVVVERDA